MLTHSGGAMGTLLGGLTQLAYRGETELFPSRGMGYGAGLGVLIAGAAATRLEIDPSRVLLIDLGASLGALTGAAVAAPVLIVDEHLTSSRSRIWLASIAGGMLAGGVVAAWTTRDPSGRQLASSPVARPFVGIIGAQSDSGARHIPAFGAGLAGTW